MANRFTDVRTSFLHLLIRPDCEPANDNADWRVLDSSRFTFASAERPLRIAREALRRNPALQIYVSLYTPPAWMKSNESRRGDGTLKEGAGYGNQSGLISTDWGVETGERRYWRSKAYHVFRQIANTTPAGTEVVEMRKTSEGDGVEFLALKHRDQLIVHLVNRQSDPVSCRLRPGWDSRAPVRALQTTAFADLQTAPAESVRSVASREGREHLALLPPYSLTTLVQRAR